VFVASSGRNRTTGGSRRCCRACRRGLLLAVPDVARAPLPAPRAQVGGAAAHQDLQPVHSAFAVTAPSRVIPRSLWMSG